MALTNFLTTDKALASVLNDKVVTPANAHINSTSNPHSVTKTQVGLANVTNDGQIPKSIIDAAGDLIYGTADNTPAKLAKGTARQQLAMNPNATAPEWVASLQSLMTASGDIVYGSGANTPAKLAKGTDGQVLTLASGLPSWAEPNVKIVTGTYTGNATSGYVDRTINIGFTPKLVMLAFNGVNGPFIIMGNISGGTAGFSTMYVTSNGNTVSTARSENYSRPLLTTNGFVVAGGVADQLNTNGYVYNYTAIG